MATMQDINGLNAQINPALQAWKSTMPGTQAYRDARNSLNGLNQQRNTAMGNLQLPAQNGGPGVTPTQQIPGMINGGFNADAANKAYNTGAGTMPGLGGMLGSAGGGNPGFQYSDGFTGYGNSSIGGPQTRTVPTTSMPGAPNPGIQSGSQSAQGNYQPTFLTTAQLNGGAMSGVQQLINQQNPNNGQGPIAPVRQSGGQAAVAPTQPLPPTNVSVPTQPAPPMITIPPANQLRSKFNYNYK